jgi:hypothetical protein
MGQEAGQRLVELHGMMLGETHIERRKKMSKLPAVAIHLQTSSSRDGGG